MSPDRGTSGAAGKGRSGDAPSRAAVRRFGLLLFGVGFLVIFLVVAIAEGVGDPSIPEGDAILVEQVPGDGGEISEQEFNRALKQAALQAGIKKVPKPGDAQYQELREQGINGLLERVWVEGLAAEMGVEVSDREVAAEFKKVREENFPGRSEYKAFLKESGLTQADVDRQVKLQKLTAEIQEQLGEEAPKPSRGEIEAYYEAAKAAQFTEPPSRSLRQILNKDRGKAEKVRAELDKSNTAKDWERLAKKYSEDSATKGKGGLQEGVTEGTLEEPLDKAVFKAPEGQIEGPIKTQRGFWVFEVQNSSPEKTQPLSAVEAQIESTLAQRSEQEFFNAFVGDFNVVWTLRTFCADGYVTERCANFESDGHPATAQPACYEADPEGGLPEACPAPVFQLVPAQPGSVTPLEPQGKPLAQRPRPEEKGESAAGATELPPGAVPPPSE